MHNLQSKLPFICALFCPLAFALFLADSFWKIHFYSLCVCVCVCVPGRGRDSKHCMRRAAERLGEPLPHFLGHSVRERWGSSWKWAGKIITKCWSGSGGLARPGRDVDSHLSPGPVGPVGSSGRTGLHQVCPKAWGGGALGAVALSVAASRTSVNVFIKLVIFFFPESLLRAYPPPGPTTTFTILPFVFAFLVT